VPTIIKNAFTLLFISIISTIANTSYAQSPEIKSLNPISELSIESKHLTEGMDFNITLPPSYQSKPNKRYFVLVNFHPQSQPYLSGLHYWLSHNGEWPWLETIIVTPKKHNADFTKLFETMNSQTGGAPLLDFLEHDLLAAIDKNYRTNKFRILNGFRGDGTLSLYVLLNHPNLFNAYIISSPNLANNYAKLMSRAKNRITQLNDKPRFLFLSTGDHQYEQADLASFNQLSQIIKDAAPQQLTWKIKHFDDSYFMSQPIMAIIAGIEALFSDIHINLKPDSAIAKQGAQAILDYYHYISEQKYGFEVSAQGSLIALGNSLLEKSPKEAVKVLTLLVKTYPNSASAYHALANAYAQLNQLNKAISYQVKAVEKAETESEWQFNKQKKYLSQYNTNLTN
jgi:enterochelin esterase-like enzyme